MNRPNPITLATTVAIVMIFGLVAAWGSRQVRAESETPQPTPAVADDRDLLRDALGLKPGEGEESPEPATELTPQEPVFDAKATPEEERASYLERERAQIAKEREALEALRDTVKADLDRLEKLRKEIDTRLTVEDQQTKARVDRLVMIYDKMRLEELVPVLQKLPEEMRIKCLARMKEKRVGQILEMLDPDAAVHISERLVNKTTKP